MPEKHNILIVDPNPQDMQLLEISLRNMGFSVTTAGSSFDALKKIEIFPPDLIISETQLKDFDGFSFCRTVKENPKWANIPFIFLSSERNIQSKVKGLQLGVDEYLTKPIFLVELVARIRILMKLKERESIEKHESRTRFSGALNEIGLVDILQTIDLSKKKGVVNLAHNDETGAIYFDDGNVIDAEYGQLEGEEALYRMMRWKDGFFDIEFRPIRRERKIELSTPQLLMEGLRRLDEWNRILEQFPPLETIFNVDARELIDRLDEIPDEVNPLIALFDGKKTLEEILRNEIFSDLDTMRIVSKLIFFGVLVETQGVSEKVSTVKDAVLVAEEKKKLEERRAPSEVKTSTFIQAGSNFKFGKAEGVDLVVDREADRVKTAKIMAEAESTPVAKVEIKKIPVKVIQDDSRRMKEEERTKEEVARTNLKPQKQEIVEEEVREETIKVKAAQIPLKVEKVEEGEKEKGKILEEIDDKLEKLKKSRDEEATLREEKEELIKKVKELEEKSLEKLEEPSKAQDKIERDARTAKMFAGGEELGVQKSGIGVGADSMKTDDTQRWTFPLTTQEKVLEEPPVKVEQELEFKEKVGEERREKVQAISLLDVKEEVEKREREKEEKKSEKLSESGVFKKEEKEFFSTQPPESQPVDTFADLDVDEGKKKSKAKLRNYVITFVILLILISGGLWLAYTKGYLTFGPDVKLLKKLETVEVTKPLPPPLHPQETKENETIENKEGEISNTKTKIDEGNKEAVVSGEIEKVKIEEGKEQTAKDENKGESGAYESLLGEAKSLLQAKKRKEAIEKFKSAVKINPEGQEALSYLIDYYKEKPSDEVLEWGRKATELGPNDSRAWFGYGLALFTAGKTGDSKKVFEHCVTITPPDSNVGKCKQMLRWVK